MESTLQSPLHFYSKDSGTPRLPILFTPSPHRRTHSISKNSESRYILSNSIDEPIFLSEIRHAKMTHKPKAAHSIHKSLIINELNLALKHIITNKKPKIIRSPKRKLTVYMSHFGKNTEEHDINGFVQAFFTHEPSPYRKAGLTSQPEALDLRAADKILQDAKRIIKHGVAKKSTQYEKVTLIEEFWKNQISREKTVRWDVFEEGLLMFLETFMVCNYGSLRKLNWKTLFTLLYNRISSECEDFSMWPVSPSKIYPPKCFTRVVKFSTFTSFVANSEINKLMFACIEDLPFYIENLRKSLIYKFSCGCYYKGEWKDGRREGNGTMNFCSGDQYIGNFNRGLREEYGKLKGSSYLYTGDFKRDKFNGYGKMVFPDNSSYEGLWMKNDFSSGKYDFADGTSYTGEWYNFCFQGKGKLMMADGSRKKGTWRNSKLCGEGSIKLPDSTVIRGFFDDDVLQGKDNGPQNEEND